jgi:hypothetical protein
MRVDIILPGDQAIIAPVPLAEVVVGKSTRIPQSPISLILLFSESHPNLPFVFSERGKNHFNVS